MEQVSVQPSAAVVNPLCSQPLPAEGCRGWVDGAVEQVIAGVDLNALVKKQG